VQEGLARHNIHTVPATTSNWVCSPYGIYINYRILTLWMDWHCWWCRERIFNIRSSTNCYTNCWF